ncbi:amidohydrolase, partial [Klebsiella pneumoniae]|nr:amidohydrolase [Klebsiella pneumoniae]
AAGQLAARVVLSTASCSVAEEEIKGLAAGRPGGDGKVGSAAGPFSPLAPPPRPVLPEWAPVVTGPGQDRSAPPAPANIG